MRCRRSSLIALILLKCSSCTIGFQPISSSRVRLWKSGFKSVEGSDENASTSSLGTQENLTEPTDELAEAWSAGKQAGTEIRDDISRRFRAPVVNDQGLVITDALIAGVVVPGLEIFAAVASGGPLPHWVVPSMGLVSSVLTRGATLAACFCIGAFAAEAYDRRAFDYPPPDGRSDRYLETLKRVWSAGAFAAGLLIVVTQLRTGLSIGFGVQFGDNPASDMVLLEATDDLIRDGLAEAAGLTAWRLYRTSISRFDTPY